MNENPGQGVNINDLSKEDFTRIVMRDQQVKRELHGRVGQLMGENVELLVVINELQASLSQAQQVVEQPDQLQFPSD